MCMLQSESEMIKHNLQLSNFFNIPQKEKKRKEKKDHSLDLITVSVIPSPSTYSPRLGTLRKDR